jgi:hypothetical protein
VCQQMLHPSRGSHRPAPGCPGSSHQLTVYYRGLRDLATKEQKKEDRLQGRTRQNAAREPSAGNLYVEIKTDGKVVGPD